MPGVHFEASFRFAIVFAAFLTGCSDGGGTAPLNSGQTLSHGGSLASTTSAVESVVQTYAASVPVSNDLLYISNLGTNTITVYHHDAQGNTAPLDTIGGSNTGLSAPGQLSEDAAGNLYVANGSLFKTSSASGVLVFAHGANGNVAPIRRIPVAPGFVGIEAMTVDQSTGKIFIYEADGARPNPTLFRYPPNATIGTAAFAQGLDFYPAIQLASDSTGANLLEAHNAVSPNAAGFGVATIQKQFSNGTPPNIVRNTYWFLTAGIADDPTTKTYLAISNGQPGGGIYRLAEDTTGSGMPGQPFSPAPVSIITSDACGGQLALGYLRNIYVVHSKASGCPADAVYVYNHDAYGAAVPIRVLSGTATKLSSPVGIYEGK